MMQLAHPAVSIILLCYREGEYIPVFVSEVLEEVRKLNIPFELVIVANFTKMSRAFDRSPDIARELSRKNRQIVVVSVEREGTVYGWDVRSGINASSGEAIMYLDGDGQIPASAIGAVYEKFKSGSFDVVQARRDDRRDGFLRVLNSMLFNTFMRLLFPRVSVRDTNAKPKVLSRRILDRLDLRADDWFIDAEFVIKVSTLGLRIGEVPITFLPHRRQSHINFMSSITFFFQMVVYRFRTLLRSRLAR